MGLIWRRGGSPQRNGTNKGLSHGLTPYSIYSSYIAMHSAKAIPIDRGLLTVVAATHIFKMLEYTVYNCMTLRGIKKEKHIQDLSYMIVRHETSQNVACLLWHVAVLLLDLL